MTLLSAYQDFVMRTLAALGGEMARLRYVAGLRRENGRYEHWGLSRTHGDAAAQDAMRSAHGEVLLAVLRTPVRELFQQELAGMTHGAGRPKSKDLLPEGASKAAALHLSSTLVALDALARARARSTRPAA